MKKKKIKFLFFYNVLLIIFILIFNTPCKASGNSPELIGTLSAALEQIENWLLMLATPAAAVAVGVGVFMKKFSFGDEERIRIAKKLIRGSLFSYGFILAINLILSTIKSLIT